MMATARRDGYIFAWPPTHHRVLKFNEGGDEDEASYRMLFLNYQQYIN